MKQYVTNLKSYVNLSMSYKRRHVKKKKKKIVQSLCPGKKSFRHWAYKKFMHQKIFILLQVFLMVCP